LNGTCNYILSRMSEADLSYEDALQEAQELGYAEADPTLDVEGEDSAHKLAVLARLAFGQDVRLDDVACEGITEVKGEDLQYADSLGYTVKLLAMGIRTNGRLQLRVHPTLLRHEHPLAAIGGAGNAVCVHGDAVGEVVLTGQGAGRWPTASAVVADVCRVGMGTYRTCFGGLTQFGDVERPDIVPFEDVRLRYYFRVSALDRPGVLAQMAGILGEEGISIASCIQQGLPSDEEQHVPVVIMTHEAREGDVQAALQRINELDCIEGSKTCMLRVQDI
jgi:homoserine dehydrogenase